MSFHPEYSFQKPFEKVENSRPSNNYESPKHHQNGRPQRLEFSEAPSYYTQVLGEPSPTTSSGMVLLPLKKAIARKKCAKSKWLLLIVSNLIVNSIIIFILVYFWRSTAETTGNAPKIIKCTEDYVKFQDFCYKMNTTAVSNEIATEHCKSEGNSNLVSIHSKEENDFLIGLAAKSDANIQMIWIGLLHLNGKFFWSDKSRVNFVNWNTLRNDTDYSVTFTMDLTNENFQWIGASEQENAAFICKQGAS